MTPLGFLVWTGFFGLMFAGMALIEGACIAASKPVPPVSTLLGETLCDSCVDLDACEDECCPYDWADFGTEVD